MSKTKTHIQYRLTDGTRVPGVTTVLGILDKPGLLAWAHKLGQQGLDYRKVAGQAADIGTIAHLLISSHWRGEKPILDDYSKADIDKAETAFLAYLEWEKGKTIKPDFVEHPMVSHALRYGGTLDFFGHIDGQPTLMDLKTGKGIYPEMRVQLAAYGHLVEEALGLVPSTTIILHVNKENGDFAAHNIKLSGKEFAMFKSLLEVYRLWKNIKEK